MITFKEFMALHEARRNPELNPKISIYKALESYKDRDDVYVSFVEDVGKYFSKKSFQDKDTRARGKGITSLDKNISGFKVGINPKSTYNTPNGLYVYPLKQAWKMYASEVAQKLIVPFGGERPEVMVVQEKPGAKIVELDKYSSKDFDRDFDKLADIIVKEQVRANKLSEAAAWEVAKSILHAAMNDSKDKSPGGQFWNMTRYTFFVLYGGLIATEMLPEYRDEVEEIFKDNNRKANYGDSTVRLKSQLNVRTPVTKSSNKWTKIFLDLGYGGIMDKAGRGIIHRSEPMQGVFFDPRSYKVIDSSYNKSYLTKPGKEDVGKDWVFTVGNLNAPMENATKDITSKEFLEGVVAALVGKYSENQTKQIIGFLTQILSTVMTLFWKTTTATITSFDNKLYDYIYKHITQEPDIEYQFLNLTLKSPSGNPIVNFQADEMIFYPPENSSASEYYMPWKDLLDAPKRDKLIMWIIGQQA